MDSAPDASKPLLAAVRQQIGMLPNLMKVVGHSPAALEGYLALNGALAKGQLDAPLRERLALGVAEFNGCDYCLSAHTYFGRHGAKLAQGELDAARDFHAGEPRADAALRFARRVAETQGRVSDADLASLRAAGFDDAGVIEIVANVALNVLTNYINNVTLTDIDFPKLATRQAA